MSIGKYLPGPKEYAKNTSMNRRPEKQDKIYHLHEVFDWTLMNIFACNLFEKDNKYVFTTARNLCYDWNDWNFTFLSLYISEENK